MFTRVLLFLIVAIAAIPTARADRAIAVGVQQYPHLEITERSRLRGCVNDARSMAAALKKYGFEVTVLTDAQATKKAVLAELGKVRSAIRPGERFVFYYAGHGTDEPKHALLPYDAQKNGTANDLTGEELYAAVSAVPARSRTVILDSCFSGGLAKPLLPRPGLRARYYARELAGSGVAGYYAREVAGSGLSKAIPVNGQDIPQVVAGSGVCYMTASMGNEKAFEEDLGGRAQGVFTYYLIQRLNGSRDLWGDIHTEVKGRVAESLNDLQHPTLSPAFVGALVFESKDGPKPPTTAPKPRTLWDEYNTDCANPKQVSVTMDPNKTTVSVGEEIRFTTKVSAEGYLVIIERDVDGQVYLLFPQGRKVEDARVQPGQTITIPTDLSKVYKPDTPGSERLKAILFGSAQKAAVLLAAFPEGDGGVPWTGMKRLRVAPATKTPFFTSEITFEVVAPASQ